MRRVRAQAAVTSALVVLIAFALCAGLTAIVVVRSQHSDDQQLLSRAVSTADDVNDPPAGVWLTIMRGTTLDSSPGLPAGLPDAAALTGLATAPTGASQERDLQIGGEEYRVLTAVRRPSQQRHVTVQAALSLRADHDERNRLSTALLLAGVLALLFAIAIGAAVGQRAVRSLVATIGRQRRFVADASHELRTPLAVVSTRVQLAERTTRDTATRSDLTAVKHDIDRMDDVLEDLLAATAPPTSAPTELTDLRAIASSVAAAMQPTALAADVALESALPDRQVLAPAAERTLRRALTALIDNAIRHTPAGGSVTVSVRDTPSGRRPHATITVADTGPGIDPSVRHTLFERHRRGSEHIDGRRRYGLGLALLAESIDRAGGRVAVQSSDAGATFEITIPTNTVRRSSKS